MSQHFTESGQLLKGRKGHTVSEDHKGVQNCYVAPDSHTKINLGDSRSAEVNLSKLISYWRNLHILFLIASKFLRLL